MSSPTSDRVHSLDTLRGVAVLGILLLNIQSFAMPLAAYFDDSVYANQGVVNRAIDTSVHVLGLTKFMTLFSMLFGAGIAMAADRGPGAAGLHHRRMLVLGVIGTAHGYLLWYGDILFWYAVVGMVVFLIRRHSTSALLGIGIGAYLLGVTISAGQSLFHFVADPQLQQKVISSMGIDPASIYAEIAAYRGDWVAQMRHRAEYYRDIQLWGTLLFGLPINGGLMVLGMVAWRCRLFDASRSQRSYALIALAMLSPAAILNAIEQHLLFHHPSDVLVEYFLYGSLTLLAAPLQAAGYAAIVMLLCQRLPALTPRLAAVGRTALSCYLLTTLICTTIFYGHGLGWFGYLDRLQQLGVVLGVWLALLIAAPLWLRYFHFGPVEWVWRSITYLKPQPMRRMAVREA